MAKIKIRNIVDGSWLTLEELSGLSSFDAITVLTEFTDISSLLSSGIYIADNSLLGGNPATLNSGDNTSAYGKTMVIVTGLSQSVGSQTEYSAIQVVISDAVYFRRIFSTDGRPVESSGALAIHEWNKSAYCGNDANFLLTRAESLEVYGTTESVSTTTGAATIAGGLGVAGAVYADTVYGAVYNDYAEYRCCKQHIFPGTVVVEVGDDSVICSSDRLQLGAMIVSDTCGFCIGDSNNAVPVAISGRVLAYPFEEREEFKKAIGRAVCSGPNGTVSIMSDQEVKDNPLAIIGTVSSVPDYNIWGSNNIDVSGRVWIKVK